MSQYVGTGMIPHALHYFLDVLANTLENVIHENRMNYGFEREEIFFNYPEMIILSI